MSQPSGLIRLSSTILLVALALAGCGEGSSSSDSSSGQNTGNAGAGEKILPEMDGYLSYDFSLRGTNDNPRVYRRNLESYSLGLVQSGDQVGGQVFAGGIFADDLFAPAVVTASSHGVWLHSRVDGESAKLSDIGKGQEPCAVQGFANNDLASGLVHLVKSGENLTCDYTAGSDDIFYWLRFQGSAVDVWEADGVSVHTDVYFNGEGNIDFVAAKNYVDNEVTLYDESGTMLQRLEGNTRVPEISPVAAPGPTRDDTYVGVISDDQFFVTTVSMLVNSGLAGAQPLLTGLASSARIATRSLKEGDRYTIIADRGVLYSIDEINRTASVLVDFSERHENAWLIEYVVVLGNKAVVLSSTSHDIDEIFTTSEAHSVDLASGEVTPLLKADSAFSVSRTESLLFINYLNAEFHFRTMIIRATGEPVAPAEETYYAASLNLARGGGRSKVFALVSTTPKNEESPVALLNPEIWEVNEVTGNYLSAVTKLPYNCQSMGSRYAINSHMSVYSFCENGFAFQELELNRGWLSFVTSDFRTIN